MYREEIEFAAKYFRQKLSDSDALTGEIDQIFLKIEYQFYTISFRKEKREYVPIYFMILILPKSDRHHKKENYN